MITTYQNIIKQIIAKRPRHANFINKSIALLSEKERLEAENYISFLISEGNSVEFIAECYLLIIDDAFIQNAYFLKNGKYKYSRFSEVASLVYYNQEFMEKYMIGLGLSSYWWENHVKIRRFFRSFIESVTPHHRYLEVGPGHGIYLTDAIRSGKFREIKAIDISEASLKLTDRLISVALNENSNTNRPSYNLQLRNFFDYNEVGEADFLVMGEVLEHVEDPSAFVRQAYKTVNTTGSVFLTTCLNAPAIDHLYNPPSLQALTEMFTENGFIIRDKCELGDGKHSLEECEEKKLTINVAYVLEKVN